MSEYQYYEFRTVDRRLSETEMQRLRLHSTRARITPTSFINEYHWGNFKGDPDAWMDKYFDGHLYFANWGTRVLQLALPASVLSEETAGLYCTTDVASSRQVSGRLILQFNSEEDGACDDSLEGDGLLSSLLPLRNEIAAGDLRCLYLGWLMGVQYHQFEDDELEPPVPPNLGKMSGALSDFADFLRIDRDLISVAVEASPSVASTKRNRKDLAAWLASLPGEEKDKVLVELMAGEEPHLGASLLARFNRDRQPGDCKAAQPGRKVSALHAALEERRKQER
jgi:hypothetical protein